MASFIGFLVLFMTFMTKIDRDIRAKKLSLRVLLFRAS